MQNFSKFIIKNDQNFLVMKNSFFLKREKMKIDFKFYLDLKFLEIKLINN